MRSSNVDFFAKNKAYYPPHNRPITIGLLFARAAHNRAATVSLIFCAFICGVYLLSPERRALNPLRDVPPLRYRYSAKGEPATVDYSLYLTPEDGSEILSFWHDIPLPIQLLDGPRRLVPMVYEIPRGSKAKFEINKESPWNPIKQDIKNGALRYYPSPSVLHYGALPRTYEHPREKDDLTGLLGDGDPLDVVDVSDLPAAPGETHWVKILGALAMEDDDGTTADWKIVAIRLTDPRARWINDLSELEALDVAHVSLHRGKGKPSSSGAATSSSAAKSTSGGTNGAQAAGDASNGGSNASGNEASGAEGELIVSSVKKAATGAGSGGAAGGNAATGTGTGAAGGAGGAAGPVAGEGNAAAAANPAEAALAAAADAAAGTADANGKEIVSTAAKKAVEKKKAVEAKFGIGGRNGGNSNNAAAANGASASIKTGLKKIVASLDLLKVFLRDYKKKSPTDPDPVSFGFGGRYLDAATAVDVVRHHHIHWCRVIDEAAAGKRVGSLSVRFGGYREDCDAARQKWSVELAEDEALGALAGEAGAAAGEADAAVKALWLPVESESERVHIA